MSANERGGGGGSLRSIEAAREGRKRREEAFVADLAALSERTASLEGQLAQIRGTLRRLVEASNANSLLLAGVERFLDASSPGWDDGIREDLKRKQVLLRERAALLDRVAAPREEGDAAVRGALAVDLWFLAKEIGTTLEDGPVAVGLHLQAGESLKASDLLAELRGLHPEPPAALEPVFRKLEERIAELGGASPSPAPGGEG